MLIVGVTGGAGSGKTTVSRIFQEEGAYVIDADQIARELVQPRRQAWREIVRAFGRAILREDATIDRKRLAELVFSDPERREVLNRILHPRIKRAMEKKVRLIGRRDPQAIVILDAPLLIETGLDREMDRVIVVTSKVRQQIERLKRRASLTEEEARRILRSQMRIGEKVKKADHVIRNEGELEETRRKAREVFQELKRLAKGEGAPKGTSPSIRRGP
ncbi:MAG: dephospho-CoA kinase [Desulfobacterota bacterium]|nr:dephospho-CoA kinase [Thermodesulfobacteriota bacterium]